ncbi:hypothetical protein HGRIS_003122 [Hohenbuehelia grisea]|uniref:F-box domain-containing protein n=1 Tax=Hohenbuehelia grisea TaxID=104357 RepID=A0ABR3JN98_9AGAR
MPYQDNSGSGADGGPINRIPVELLQKIFLESVVEVNFPKPAAPNATRAPLLFTRVFRTWRSCVLSCPQLWSNLKISFLWPEFESDAGSDAPPNVVECYRTWLERSGARPLHLWIDVQYWAICWWPELPRDTFPRRLLDLLRDYIGRCSSIALNAEAMHIRTLLSETGFLNDFVEVFKLATNLRSVHVQQSRDAEFSQDRETTPSLLFQDLRLLSISHFQSHLSGFLTNWGNIEVLFLNDFIASHLHTLLEACVNLRRLGIQRPSITSVIPEGPPVVLERLVAFNIWGPHKVANDIVSSEPWPLLQNGVYIPPIHVDRLLPLIKRSKCKLEFLKIFARIDNDHFLKLLPLISETIVDFAICFFPHVRPDFLKILTPDPGSTDTSQWPFPKLEQLELNQCLQAPDGALGRMLEARCEIKRMRVTFVLDIKHGKHWHVDSHPKDLEKIRQLESRGKLDFRGIICKDP